MRTSKALLMLLALGGCSTPHVGRVQVPVQAPCNVALPAPPARCVPLGNSRAEWLRCELAECEERRGYQAELEAALKACTSQ